MSTPVSAALNLRFNQLTHREVFYIPDNSPRHWNNAFYKFGYDDGDGNVQTHLVAKVLEDAGYEVKYSRWSPHNTIIYSIQKDGVEYMPDKDSEFRLGYTHPAYYLPTRIQKLLDGKISAKTRIVL